MSKLCRFCALVLLINLIYFSQAAPFTANSAVMPVRSGSSHQLWEIDVVAGTVLQRLDLPSDVMNFVVGAQPTLDPNSQTIGIVTTDRATLSDSIGLAYNVQGQVASRTTLTGISPGTQFATSGTNAWFPVAPDLVYTTVGSTTTTPQTIASDSIACMQLVGTKLYAVISFSMALMDPVKTSGTGTFNPLSIPAIVFFVYRGSTLYTYAQTTQTLYKYTLDAAGINPTLSYSLSNVVIARASGLYVVEISGATYIVISSYKSGSSQLFRFNDTVGPSPTPTCSDGYKNQDESDTDCGGSKCSKCGTGKVCSGAGDCSSGVCTSGKCAAPTCSDTVKNQDETDVDCGGTTCSTKCADTKSCLLSTDCLNGFCNSNSKCATPTCSDTAKNQDETDVDCGGSKCSKCATGKACSSNSDCSSNKCTSNVCAISCTDGIMNQDETDIDCGGSTCSARCANTKSCGLSTDCTSNYCNPNNKCSTPSCNDGFLNQDETDVDCGGNTCSTKCSDTKSCLADSDCANGYCDSNKKCATPTCADSVKNQDETDVDCGGSKCSKCAIGKVCSSNSDCSSNKCTSNVCAASCTDGIQNQDETDIDCGGSCSACANGKSCSLNADCQTEYCNPNGKCSTQSCNDGWQNQNEVDVDCGGICSSCADGKICTSGGDCSSAYCNPDNKCSTPSCSDGFTNQDETDTDCGGDTCSARCAIGKSCISHNDCVSIFCDSEGSLCAAASCSDGVMNQDETDTDCGGNTCSTRCTVGQTCTKNSDCDSNTCSGTTCVNAPIAPPVPVDVPVSAPTNTPFEEPQPIDAPNQPEQQPQSVESPVTLITTPDRKLVSDGVIIMMSVISFIIAGIMLAL